jgi:hypothetical protein
MKNLSILTAMTILLTSCTAYNTTPAPTATTTTYSTTSHATPVVTRESTTTTSTSY